MYTLDLGNLITHLTLDDTQFTAKINKAINHVESMSKKVTAIGTKMTMAVTAPLVGLGVKAAYTFANFDDAMTKSTAIMGNMSAKMRMEMEGVAKTLSKDSVTSATELAKSYFYLASAGLDAAQSIKALPVVEKFAVAGAFDMAQATDLLTDAQSALGLTVKDTVKNTENMVGLSDVLVKANTLANASVLQFSEALTNEAGAALKQYNIALEEGMAVLAAYADQGIKGQVAGSMFGRMTRLLIKAVNDNEAAFTSMNVRVKDSGGNLLNLADIMGDITKATAGMGATQKAAALESLGFEARIQQAVLPLLGASDKIRQYEAELRKAGGTTAMVSDKQLKSLSSQMKILWNNINLVFMQIGKNLAPTLIRVAGYIRGLTDAWAKLSSTTQSSIVIFAGLVAVMGPVLIMIGQMGLGISTLMSIAGVGFPMLVSGFKKVAISIAASSTAQKAWVDMNYYVIGRMRKLQQASDYMVLTNSKKVTEGLKGLLSRLYERLRIEKLINVTTSTGSKISGIFLVKIPQLATAMWGYVAASRAGRVATIAWSAAAGVATKVTAALSTAMAYLSGTVWAAIAPFMLVAAEIAVVTAAGYLVGRALSYAADWFVNLVGLGDDLADSLYNVGVQLGLLAKEKSFEEVGEGMTKVWEDQLKAGRITQDEYDKRLSMLKDHVKKADKVEASYGLRDMWEKQLKAGKISDAEYKKRIGEIETLLGTAQPKIQLPEVPKIPEMATGTDTVSGVGQMAQAQFAGAAEQGSIEAYRTIISANSTEKGIEKNTKESVTIQKEILEVQKDLKEQLTQGTGLMVAAIA